MHILRILIAIIFMMVVSICGVWSSLIHMEMVDRLNERLPPEKRFEVLWWGPLKSRRFWEEYGREFPGDPLKRRMWIFGAIGFASLIVVFLDMALSSCIGCPTR